jgi:GNAT superfamily N-acetyltransferase
MIRPLKELPMTSEPFTIAVQDIVDQTVLDGIGNPLGAFNATKAGPDTHLPLAILIRDNDDNAILGGLCGHSFYEWMYINLFFIPDTLRGHGLGQRLLTQAEQIARARHCTGIWLNTFEFQARGFYEKQGFTLFGTIPDHPKGHNFYFLQKRLSLPVHPNAAE